MYKRQEEIERQRKSLETELESYKQKKPWRENQAEEAKKEEAESKKSEDEDSDDKDSDDKDSNQEDESEDSDPGVLKS